jgi:hypothetical protein
MARIHFNHADAHSRVRKDNSKQIMKLNYKEISGSLAAMTFAVIAFAVSLQAAALSDQDKQFLTAYGKAHDALVADDLGGAKKAAIDLGPDGAELNKSTTLDEARSAFGKLSEKAVKLADGQPGYYLAHCPMKSKDWVQTSRTVANPYGGKEMISCGEIKK